MYLPRRGEERRRREERRKDQDMNLVYKFLTERTGTLQDRQLESMD
jgi:hypothetical protein